MSHERDKLDQALLAYRKDPSGPNVQALKSALDAWLTSGITSMSDSEVMAEADYLDSLCDDLD